VYESGVLQNAIHPSVVAIVEAEDPATVAATRPAWGDLFDIAAFPIVTAEEGLERLRQLMPAQGG
jgi:hypothetical protein